MLPWRSMRVLCDRSLSTRHSRPPAETLFRKTPTRPRARNSDVGRLPGCDPSRSHDQLINSTTATICRINASTKYAASRYSSQVKLYWMLQAYYDTAPNDQWVWYASSRAGTQLRWRVSSVHCRSPRPVIIREPYSLLYGLSVSLLTPSTSATDGSTYCFDCLWTVQLKKLRVDFHAVWGICRLWTTEQLVKFRKVR